MRFRLFWVSVLTFWLVSSAMAKAGHIQTVKVGLLEALAISNSTSSERYRRAFEAAVYYGIGENEKRLNRCGYRFQVEPSYFETSDRTSPVKAAEALENGDTWIVFGPRRSEDYLLAASALKATALISPMANSRAAVELRPPFFTMYPATSGFTKVMVQVLKKENYGQRYGALIDVTNPAAVDFETDFDGVVKGQGYEKKFSIDVAGDEPDLSPLLEALKNNPIDFLLLPNNSKLVGFTITKLAPIYPNVKFVGAHGWGDHQYGFVSNPGVPENAQGFCLRYGGNYPRMCEAKGIRSLDYNWKGGLLTPNSTFISVIHFIRTLTSDLCTQRPKSKAQFLKQVGTFRPDHYASRESYSVYKLKNGKLVFGYDVGKSHDAKLAE